MKAFINLAPGTVVEKGGRRYVISHLLDLESVLAKDQETGKGEVVRVEDITPISSLTKSEETIGADVTLIDHAKWKEAEGWYDRLCPLLSDSHRTAAKVKKIAEEAGVHISTVYRKLARLESFGTVSALATERRDGGRGKGRLDPNVETIIKSTIDEFHFNKEKKKLKKTKTIDEVERRLRNAGLKPPHRLTIYTRIRDEERKREAGRPSSIKEADGEPHVHPSGPLGADYPLAVVQIDHTLLDVIVVDEIHRLPIGRPWITVAIDVFSRMVVGFYLSLDPPGNTGTGQCIVHAILRKETWLAGHDITTPWSCWGMMNKIHADNAGEFRGDMLKRACKEYGIDLEWRPVKKPHYGAHIERLLGTFLGEIHTLPGTTFSNPEERGEYDSEKYSAMTMSGLEKWIALYITGVYHQRYHSSLFTTPIKRYEQGIFGTDELPGRGFPLQVRDDDRLRLDFMPAIERTVQDYGVMIGEISYYSGVLSRWVKAPDPQNSKVRRKFIFKRDPRDISVIYFYDPNIKQYFRIPYRDTSHPPMSIWEYRKARRHLESQGRKDVNETLIFDTFAQMRAVVEKSTRESKSARRDEQRHLMHQKTSKPKAADESVAFIAGEEQASIIEELPDVTPFDEIEN